MSIKKNRDIHLQRRSSTCLLKRIAGHLPCFIIADKNTSVTVLRRNCGLALWKDIQEMYNSCFDTLSGLHHLSLVFRPATHYIPGSLFFDAPSSQGQNTRVPDFIAQAPLLRSLHILPGVWVDLPNLIKESTELRHLKSLSLDKLPTTEGYLREFLLKRATTLRTLELSDVHLEREGNRRSCCGISWGSALTNQASFNVVTQCLSNISHFVNA